MLFEYINPMNNFSVSEPLRTGRWAYLSAQQAIFLIS